MKKFAVIILVVLFVVPRALCAQQAAARPYWFTLETGKEAFRNGDYGRALMLFEDARRQRQAFFTRHETNLITLLSLGDVRRMNDDLELIEKYIADKHYDDAAEALAELYYRVPKKSLGGSGSRALGEIGRLKGYPEAEFWLGECYLREGEPNLALIQYQKAWDQRRLMENRDLELEILYKIPEIYRLRRDYPRMEEALLNILALPPTGKEEGVRDSLWDRDTGAFARQAMMRTLEGRNGLDRFLTLYRYNNREVEKAHRLLGMFYYRSGRHLSAPDHLMFSFLIQNTVIIEEIMRHQFDFTYTNLADLAAEAAKYPELTAYMDRNGYYKTAYYFAASLFAAGKSVPAAGIFRFVAGMPDAGEWQVRARGQLLNPYIETPIENP